MLLAYIGIQLRVLVGVQPDVQPCCQTAGQERICYFCLVMTGDFLKEIYVDQLQTYRTIDDKLSVPKLKYNNNTAVIISNWDRS